jgi:hypothetical protein
MVAMYSESGVILIRIVNQNYGAYKYAVAVPGGGIAFYLTYSAAVEDYNYLTS